MKRAVRYIFSWPVGLFVAVFLLVFWAWFLVYRPTAGESKRIERIAAEFKSHGCRSIHAETVPMFETHWLFKHLLLEKKVLRRLNFGTGSEVPGRFLEYPPFLPDLEAIGFLDSNPNDAEFIWAAQNPNVAFFFVAGAHQITARGFRALGHRSGKCQLVLTRSSTIEEDLRHLAACSPASLESLLLNQCDLNENCFIGLAGLGSLRQLGLFECTGLSTEGFERIGRLPLTSLHISDHMGNVDDHILEIICQMPELAQLHLPYSSRISVRAYDSLKTSPKLFRVRGIPEERRDEFDEFFRLRLETTP